MKSPSTVTSGLLVVHAEWSLPGPASAQDMCLEMLVPLPDQIEARSQRADSRMPARCMRKFQVHNVQNVFQFVIRTKPWIACFPKCVVGGPPNVNVIFDNGRICPPTTSIVSVHGVDGEHLDIKGAALPSLVT